MDGSNLRKSDAAATRKRRSSILKSQRSVRAPLSELEFNVATPTDQAKSRRVSFSRRTGVAEFEIHEATTAWKNVYEEHNKSQESSANESGMKAGPRRVAHLGGRASHFTDDEADAIDARACAPRARAELCEASHSTVQLLDAHPGLRELTDNLDVDFSALAPLSDDLDVLQQDIDRDTCRPNISEYSIDVDFNSTHITLKADDDDMSITDTIRSPTVAATEKKSQVDWTADKENIVVNPYIEPKASDNFAVSDDCEDVLVFDGKKCKFQSNLDISDDDRPSRTVVYDTTAGDMSVTQAVVRVVLPARDEVNITHPGHVEQRTVLLDDDMAVTGIVPAQLLSSDFGDDRKPSRTIVYDDAAADMSVTQAVARVAVPARNEVIPGACEQKTVFLDDDMAVTRAVPAQILLSEDLRDDGKKPSRTIVYHDATADMSVTQAVARVVVPARNEVIPGACEQKTVFLDDDMAVTRAVPAQILLSEDLRDDGKKPSRTIVYHDATADMSVTQAVARVLLPGQDEVIDRKTIFDMAITRPRPTQILPSEDRQTKEPNATRRRTVVFGNDDGDISVTQAVHTNIINAESSEIKQPEPNMQGTMYFEDIGDMSVTQAVPADLILEPRRKTIVFDDDNGHISVTEAVPAGALLAAEHRDSVEPGLDNRPENTERRRTILYNNEDADISVTGVVMADIHEAPKVSEPENIGHRKSIDGAETNKRSPVKEGSQIYSYVNGNISKTLEAIADMSVTQAVPADHIQEPQRRKTIVFEDDDGNISMTETVPAGALLAAGRRSSVMPELTKPEDTKRRRTVVYNNENGNISITGVVTASIHIPFADPNKRSPEKEGIDISYVNSVRPQVSPGSSPAMSGYTPNASFDAMSNSPKCDSFEGRPNGSERASILDALLDMSQASVEALAIEYIPEAAQATASNTTLTNTIPDSNKTITTSAPTSEENERDEAVKDNEIKENVSNLPSSMEGTTERLALEGSLPLPVEYKKDKHGIVCKLQHKLSELKGLLHVKEKTSPRKSISKPASQSRYTEAEKNSSLNTSTAPPESSVELEENLSQMNDSDFKSASPEHDKIAGQEDNKTLMVNLSSKISTHNNESSTEQEQYGSLTSSHQECDMEPEQKEQSQWTGQADDTRAILDALSDFTDTRRSDHFEPKPSSPDKSRRSYHFEPKPSSPDKSRRSEHFEPKPSSPDKSRRSEDFEPKPSSPDNSRRSEDFEPKPSSPDKSRRSEDFEPKPSSPDKSRRSEDFEPKPSSPDNSRRTEDFEPKPSSPDKSRRSEHFEPKPSSPDKSRSSEHFEPKPSSPDNSRRTEDFEPKPSSPDKSRRSEHFEPKPSSPDKSRRSGDFESKPSRLDQSRRSEDFESKPSIPDKSRRSSAPVRKSMVMSRENLLREISMAQAIMKTEMQQTEEPADSSDEQEATPPRHSNEVVKTLRFDDDESILEPRVLHKPSVVKSPARRASPVIPTYEVSDHVKALVHDLIKPMVDVAPQILPDFTRYEPSRGSQVDNLESSQIDLIPSSPVLIEPRLPSCLRSPEPVARHSEMQVEYRSPSPRRLGNSKAPVIVFDHRNPLNNILLPPPDQSIAHKYNPRRSQESVCPSLESQAVQTEEERPQSHGVECGMVLVTGTVDRAVASERSVRDTGVNTSIVMKGNRELLAASSSLTLVDDALARSAFDVVEPGLRSRSRSPVRVIFQLDDPYSSVKLDSELTSCDDSSECKRQKRGHTASKGLEVTPKPAIKVQKVCNSSKVARRLSSSEQDVPPSEHSRASPASSVTVAAAWSCVSSGAERVDWKPELMHEPSSKNLACEQDPGVNVVAKIDVLPFMGTSECEWESRAADTWSFRLLRARLRLVVRLEHRACNTTRAAVRADTPVRLVLVQHARDSDNDPVAALCLCLAAEALQRVAARGCARAGMVPGLLRRCAALARVALRWGRTMRAARAELAFSLADDGLLSLKVANIPLRSVWEVRLRVELVDAGRGAPWPRAVQPRVIRVVAAWAPAEHELQALLDTVPEDWGHVPRTVWKLFKYLKNKLPEDDLLT